MTRKMRPTANKVAARRSIADRLSRKMRSYIGAKVVDLSAVREGSNNDEALQKIVASRAALAEFDPAHAVYVCAQNQTSVMAEQRMMLPEVDRFVRLIGNA